MNLDMDKSTKNSNPQFWAIQNSRTKLAEEVGRSQVTQIRMQEESTCTAVVGEGMHRDWPSVAHNKMRTVANIVYQFVQCFCLTYTTIVLPFADK